MAIKNQEFFDGSLPANFDGLFDWDLLTKYALPKYGGIDFMDLDATLERNKRFLIFETKVSGSKIPLGQQITLNNLHGLGCFTLIVIQFDKPEKDLRYIHKIGVLRPNEIKITYLNLEDKSYLDRINILVDIVRGWWKDVDNYGKLTIKQVKQSKLKTLWSSIQTKWDTLKIGGLFQKSVKSLE
jgi:hypothetical protein